MVLANNRFTVEVKRDTQYTLFSTDNQYYDYIINTEDYSRNDYICVYCITVNNNTDSYKIAIIARGYGQFDNCAILDEDRLVVLADNYMVLFNLSTRKLDNMKEVIDFGTGMEIYTFDGGYIINGEIDIIKVDKSGNKIWSFSGRDIWVTLNGEDALQINGNKLILTDFNGDTYKIDKYGKEIKGS
jgi:hypothetical protein